MPEIPQYPLDCIICHSILICKERACYPTNHVMPWQNGNNRCPSTHSRSCIIKMNWWRYKNWFTAIYFTNYYYYISHLEPLGTSKYTFIWSKCWVTKERKDPWKASVLRFHLNFSALHPGHWFRRVGLNAWWSRWWKIVVNLFSLPHWRPRILLQTMWN